MGSGDREEWRWQRLGVLLYIRSDKECYFVNKQALHADAPRGGPLHSTAAGWECIATPDHTSTLLAAWEYLSRTSNTTSILDGHHYTQEQP